MSLWQWIGAYVAVAIGCFFILVLTIPKLAGGSRPSPSAETRIVVILGAVVLMAMIGRDLYRRAETAQIIADAAAADRDPPSETELQHEEINGPALVALYFQQGYAWAEAHGVERASECPADNRPVRDGCRAYVVRQR